MLSVYAFTTYRVALHAHRQNNFALKQPTTTRQQLNNKGKQESRNFPKPKSRNKKIFKKTSPKNFHS